MAEEIPLLISLCVSDPVRVLRIGREIKVRLDETVIPF